MIDHEAKESCQPGSLTPKRICVQKSVTGCGISFFGCWYDVVGGLCTNWQTIFLHFNFFFINFVFYNLDHFDMTIFYQMTSHINYQKFYLHMLCVSVVVCCVLVFPCFSDKPWKRVPCVPNVYFYVSYYVVTTFILFVEESLRRFKPVLPLAQQLGLVMDVLDAIVGRCSDIGFLYIFSISLMVLFCIV